MKKIFAFLMVIVTLVGFSIPVFAAADPSISPCLNNGSNCSYGFVITSSGVAQVKVSYYGMEGVTTKVTVTTYIQKKILGLFWTTVDIGTENKQWIDTSTNLNGYFIHTYQLKSTGTYRAVFKVVFSGTGGTDDVLENNIERKYS